MALNTKTQTQNRAKHDLLRTNNGWATIDGTIANIINVFVNNCASEYLCILFTTCSNYTNYYEIIWKWKFICSNTWSLMEKKAFYYSGTILWNNTHKHTRTHLEFWLIPNSFKDVPLMGLSEGAVIGTYLKIFRARYIYFCICNCTACFFVLLLLYLWIHL